MLKYNTNKLRDSFILMTGVLVMAIICYLGINEIKAYNADEKPGVFTEGINAIEDSMKGKLNVDESFIFGEKKSDVNSFDNKAVIIVK